jgi:hypothetical protein
MVSPACWRSFVATFNQAWHNLAGELQAKAVSRPRERFAVERKIANLVDAVSEGHANPALFAKLNEREATRAALADADPDAVQAAPQFGPGRTESDAARISELTAALNWGKDPEGLEIARGLIDQVIIHPVGPE